MKLTIKDRVYIPSIMPKEGGMIEMITVRGIVSKIEITPEEIEECGIKDTERGVTWQKESEKDVEFTSAEKEMLRNAVKRLDDEKKITLAMLPTAEKIYQLST